MPEAEGRGISIVEVWLSSRDSTQVGSKGLDRCGLATQNSMQRFDSSLSFDRFTYLVAVLLRETAENLLKFVFVHQNQCMCMVRGTEFASLVSILKQMKLNTLS